MDIAKYIGLFLFKNNFCYIHGLGNLELRKKPAAYDGAELQAPKYEVVLTPTGSIDDNLANFIATNEQISISKAANTLREFSIESKAQLQQGKEVIIPAIGKFVYVNDRINFVTDPNIQYTPPALPALKFLKRAEEEPVFKNRVAEPSVEHTSSGTSVNWGKIILWVVILGVLAAAVIFGISYMNKYNSGSDVVPVKDTVVAAPVQQNAPVIDTAAKPVDSAAAHAAATPATTPAANGNMDYKVILKTYENRAAAEKRVKQLTGFGHKNLDVIAKDSTHYLVVISVNGPMSDTTHMIDSLRRNFNPKDPVSIYHQ
ncbi:hypothetical protein [Taibaiella soli]|uniref:CCDC81-like prokaryotic HU domain-containing protein n=1 Tax=Taibaiella soli TaxID=1649169 RepID=A0A2W2A8Z8_9BACT|nr:hypothetical protein [Taibaiella soli]PZF71741.1 hypothetical protein DN068_16885 [Taibaiella soli]